MRENDKPIFFFSSSVTKIFFKLTLLQGSHLPFGTENAVCHVGPPHHGRKTNKQARYTFPLSMPRASLLKAGLLFLNRAEKDL